MAFVVLFLSSQAQAQTVSIEEYRLPTEYSYPVGLSSDNKGRIWLAAHMVHKIVSFDPEEKAFKEYGLPDGSNPVDVAVDDNDVVWFTLSSSTVNAIGSLSQDTEKISIYKVPTPDSEPNKIAIAPDGTVWFTEKKANKIGRFKDGEFKEYDVPTPNSQPAGLDIDSKGLIWFTQSVGNKIAKIDLEGAKITEYVMPNPLANPADLTVDKDDNVWIVEMNGNNLTMLDTSKGEFNEATIPHTGAVPVSLVVTGEGVVWFTENKGNNIGMFDPYTAMLKEYDIPTSRSLPTGIHVDNRGRVWFTEADRDANSLAMLSVTVDEAPAEVQEKAPSEEKPPVKEPRKDPFTRAAIAVFFVILFLVSLWYILRKRGRGE